MDDLTRERYPHGIPSAERYRFIPRHVFQSGLQVDFRGRHVCERCGSLEKERVHRVPDRTDDDRAAEARRMGER